MDARWQEVATRVTSALAREPAARIFDFSRLRHGSGAAFLLRCHAVATAVAVARAASCRTQRASPVNAHMLPLTLSPANLSFQASTIRCGSHGQRPIAPEEWYKEAEDPHTPPANQ